MSGVSSKMTPGRMAIGRDKESRTELGYISKLLGIYLRSVLKLYILVKSEAI